MAARRYYLRARRLCVLLDDPGQESAWHTKQISQPGTALPPTLPCLARLNAAGYLALEDFGLDTPLPVDAEELIREAHLQPFEARAVLDALRS